MICGFFFSQYHNKYPSIWPIRKCYIFNVLPAPRFSKYPYESAIRSGLPVYADMLDVFKEKHAENWKQK